MNIHRTNAIQNGLIYRCDPPVISGIATKLRLKPVISSANLFTLIAVIPGINHLAGVLLLLLAATTAGATSLPGYNIDINQTSVSGISSGGYMAVQFAIAHSEIVTGAGVFAAGPYRCGADGISTALGLCMQGRPDPQKAINETRSAADAGRIAPLENIGRQRIWLFSGYNDGVVKQSVTNSLYAYFKHYVPTGHVHYQNSLGAGHAMITKLYGKECPLTGGAFINDCDYDGAGMLLQHIYGALASPSSDSPGGTIISFDQSAYAHGDGGRIGLAEKGYLYVPESCARGEECRVHIVFHGCRQYAEQVNDLFYRHAGYNSWAENNRIIVLYPQTQATHLSPFNPNGCWDWWGYTGPEFAYRDGAQIKAVRSMINQLSKGHTAAEPTPDDRAPELNAIDATHDSVSLVWNRGAHASGYHLDRSSEGAIGFQRVTDRWEQGVSYVDRGLSPDTTYRYRLQYISDTGELLESNTATITTRSLPASCDPYFNDNVTHVSEGRARVWFGFTFARGSWDYMGLWNLFTETALFRDNDGFKVGVCPIGNGS